MLYKHLVRQGHFCNWTFLSNIKRHLTINPNSILSAVPSKLSDISFICIHVAPKLNPIESPLKRSLSL